MMSFHLGLETLHGIVGVKHQDGRVVLKNGADLDQGQA